MIFVLQCEFYRYVNLMRIFGLVWFLKVAGVDTGNIFRWRTMAASFSKCYGVDEFDLLRYYLPR